MKVYFDVRWLVDDNDREIDHRLLQLLAKIKQTGSLQTAAEEINVSYRTAWEIIRHWNDSFNAPLCVMERGRGSKLTPLGEKIIQTKVTIDTNYADALNDTAHELNDEISKLTGQQQNRKKLSAYVSHDLTIGYLQALLEKSTNLNIEFVSRGSLESLRLLNLSQSDIVGFHFPEGELAQILAPTYSPWLDDEKHLLVQLTTREQGLMIKPTMTEHITSLQGLTRRSVKFINRQKGSGTRAIFDELIKLNGINKKDINGYEREEFTHTAVAAMISSGHADVGFGLKAAAVQFKLAFIPLTTEAYIIAMNRSLPKDIKDEIRLAMKNTRLKGKINKLSGYNTKLTGKIIHANKLLSHHPHT